jgi:hypothetical protein
METKMKKRSRPCEERKAQELREIRSLKVWGMPRSDYDLHVAKYGDSTVKGSPMRAYITHRANAEKRGILWLFTFPEWWAIWSKDDRWERRGAKKDGLVMARHADGDTPYSKDTVYICTCTKNIKDGVSNRNKDKVRNMRKVEKLFGPVDSYDEFDVSY